MKFFFILLSFFISCNAFSIEFSTSRTYAEIKKSVFQIKTSRDANSSKASYGTGFVVDTSGLLITNYHVISTVIQDRYNLYKIYVVDKDKNFEAEVLDFSVVHDLALIRIKNTFSTALKISPTLPRRGEKVFSIGLPKDLNMSIVDGNFNGLLTRGVYQRFLMSTPVNSGMSGGPTVNKEGKVVGINVSILLGSENISFAVPGYKALEMLNKFKESGKIAERKQFDGKIQDQLLEVEKSLIESMKNNKTKSDRVGNYRIAAPSKDLKCWTKNDTSTKNTFKYFRQTCYLKDSAYIKSGLYSGTYELNYLSLQNINRNNVQFISALNHYFKGTRGHTGLYSTRRKGEELTKFSCEEDIYVNKNNLPFKISYCLHGYVRYPKLYRIFFKVATLKEYKNGLVVKIQSEGFTKEGSLDFVKYHIDNIKKEN